MQCVPSASDRREARARAAAESVAQENAYIQRSEQSANAYVAINNVLIAWYGNFHILHERGRLTFVITQEWYSQMSASPFVLCAVPCVQSPFHFHFRLCTSMYHDP